MYSSMAKKNKKISQEQKLLSMGAVLLVMTLIIISVAFTFLINNALPAVTPGNGDTNEETAHFNLEGFEELGL